MRYFRAGLKVMMGVILVHPLTAASENWPQFRGPSGRGISATAAPTHWDVTTGTNVLWQVELPGLGHASPIVWEDRVYVATAVQPGRKSELKVGIYGAGDSYPEKAPHQWRLIALDKATGRVLWDRLALEAVPRQERHTKASHCNATPATDGKHLVTIFGSEGLFCFDMEGSLKWRKDLGKMDAGPWDAPSLQWSFASSPLLRDGKVVVQCDVLSEQFLALFNAENGELIWRTPRQEVANWCTPALASIGDHTQIIVNGWKQLAGYDFETGRTLWTLSGGGDIPVPAPLVDGDFAIFTSAHGRYRPLRAIRLQVAKGDITPPSLEMTNAAVAWCHPRLGSYMQTPIADGGLVWSCDWQGVLTCVAQDTGEIRYSERLGSGGQAFTASGVLAGGYLYFTSETGEVYVIARGPTLSVVATNELGGLCLATPAAVDGTLFFRTTERLLTMGKAPQDR